MQGIPSTSPLSKQEVGGTAVRIQSGHGTSSINNQQRISSNDHILIREQAQSTKNSGKGSGMMLGSHGNSNSMY